MGSVVNSRSVAEHLYTLASLLDAEALRLNALRSKSGPKLSEEARDVRLMADQLWEADTAIDVSRPQPARSTLLSNGSTQLGTQLKTQLSAQPKSLSGQGRHDDTLFAQPPEPMRDPY